MRIVITEGELKALSATHQGVHTLSVGGVWNWKAKKSLIPLLPALERVAKNGREIIIAFDSDARDNPQVAYALDELASALLQAGARVRIASIPNLTEGQKTGLDDYLVAKGIDSLREDVLAKAEEFQMSLELFRMNSQYVFVESPTMVRRVAGNQQWNIGNWRDVEGPARCWRLSGNGKPKQVSAGPEWLKWPQRNTVNSLTYKPLPASANAGEAKPYVYTPDGQRLFNTWPGWPCEPKEGDVSLWHELLNHLFKTSELDTAEQRTCVAAARRYFEQWVAFPIQNPGAKLYSAAVFWGAQGGGKGLLGETIGAVYGKNFQEVTQRELKGQFNAGWVQGKQFVMGSEITGSNSREQHDELKHLITGADIRINQKFIPEFYLPNCINFLFTTNHPDAFFLEDDDRRYFIHEIPRERISDALGSDWVKIYSQWKRTQTCREALLYYFFHLDLAGFDPTAPPPMTAAKREMQEHSRNQAEQWLARLAEDPDAILEKPYSLWTAEELFRLFQPDDGKFTLGGFSKFLSKYFSKACGGQQVRVRCKNWKFNRRVLVKEQKVRLWIIRNQDQLRGCSAARIGMHYAKERNERAK